MSTLARMVLIIRRIPSGKVMTYGDLAYCAGAPGAARAVSLALNSDPRLPWERVVGADGQIKRPGVLGQEQRLRLRQQGVSFIGLRVNLLAHRMKFTEVELP